MEFVLNDGGRAEAGSKGYADDCVTRSIAIITGKLYREVYDDLNNLAASEKKTKRKPNKSSSRNGVYRRTYERYLKSLGYIWKPTMFVGKGCQVHLSKKELPSGKLIVCVSKHMTAVIDGVIHDTHDPSRNETRCVYGYFYLPKMADVILQEA